MPTLTKSLLRLGPFLGCLHGGVRANREIESLWLSTSMLVKLEAGVGGGIGSNRLSPRPGVVLHHASRILA